MDSLDDLAEIPLELDMPVADQTAAWSDRLTDERINALVNVVSDQSHGSTLPNDS
jgi:hypothetical protein